MREIIITIGIPASGKSSYYKEVLKQERYHLLCPDEIRFKILDYKNTGIDFDPLRENEVWNEVYQILKSYLYNELKIYFDATNISYKNRIDIIKHIDRTKYKITYVYFDIPLKTCLERNSKRERNVPEDVIKRMYYSLEEPKIKEFDKLIVIRN